MHRLVIFASVAMLAAAGVSCSRSGSGILSSPSIAGTGAGVGVEGGNGGGKQSGSSSLSLVLYKDVNGNGLPNWGDQVTFNVATTASTEPYVSLTCTQNGVVVLGAMAGFYPSYPWPWTQIMTLSSTAWQGGPASCTAQLYYFNGRRNVVLASLIFTAYA